MDNEVQIKFTRFRIFALIFLCLALIVHFFIEIKYQFIVDIFRLSFAGFIIVVSYKLFIKAGQIQNLLRIVVYLFSIAGFVLALFFLSGFVFWRGSFYEDSLVYKKNKNSNHSVIVEYFDEGALGSHNRIIQAIEITPKFRLINEVNRIRMNGTWKVYNKNDSLLKVIHFKNYVLSLSDL
ncbi:MAG: hypothetical protein U0U67_01460 [Chitinophagales bacterium]